MNIPIVNINADMLSMAESDSPQTISLNLAMQKHLEWPHTMKLSVSTIIISVKTYKGIPNSDSSVLIEKK